MPGDVSNNTGETYGLKWHYDKEVMLSDSIIWSE
jgi:hypothetical protein